MLLKNLQGCHFFWDTVYYIVYVLNIFPVYVCSSAFVHICIILPYFVFYWSFFDQVSVSLHDPPTFLLKFRVCNCRPHSELGKHIAKAPYCMFISHITYRVELFRKRSSTSLLLLLVLMLLRRHRCHPRRRCI